MCERDVSRLAGEELFEAKPLEPRPKEKEGASHGKKEEERVLEGGARVRRPGLICLCLREIDE